MSHPAVPTPPGPPAATPSVTPGPTPDAVPGIVARGVRRTFGDVVAVDAMDLEAPLGKVTALVGPNGSGKTTLLLVLASLLVPDAGQVQVAGHDPVTSPREVRRRVGWMPDVFGTWETLTCREVLETVAEAFHVPRTTATGRIEELLTLVHLREFAERPTQVLSRGQKQRLGLARALVHDPQVLLLDEPASGLDPRSRVELRTVVRRLATQGKAVVISSHVLAELDEMADRAVIVAGGRTVATEELSRQVTRARPWRIRALDQGALLRSLDARSLAHSLPADSGERDGVELAIGSDVEAAALLGDLIRDGVPVLSFQPAAGVLEQAYLTLTADGDRR
ncbi:MAG: ABC transporter ATP-binding protein [Kineosporiaceae bacterium]|nr:ABC transporter ATP-binding protein [Kineosporiaceae bacterium]